MAARASRNRLFSYAIIITFLILIRIKIGQLNDYSSALGEATVDMAGNFWPFENQQEARAAFSSSKEMLGKSGGSARDDRKFDSKFASGKMENHASFYEIAIEQGTDKVTLHAYQDIYERYLPAERNGRIKILEIGVDCGAGSQAAASYNTWIEYFPNVDLYFIESDEECVELMRDEMNRAELVTGDVADKLFLEEFQMQYGSDFDVIVSSTGLTTMQQVIGLEILWKTVKPGGVFFCEFLETSYMEKYGAGRVISNTKDTMVQHLHKMIEDLMYPDPNLEAYHLKGMGVSWPRKVQFEEVESIKHIDCERQVCAVLKRAD